MYVFMADNSVDAASLGDDADPQRHTFVKKFIGPVDDDRFMTMESWVASSGIQDSDDLMLQMDIEGAEFLAILTTPDSLLARFRIMVLEVHELDQLWDENFFRFVSPAFDKLLRNHLCVHLHPNGSGGIDERQGVEIPRVIEMTFMRRDCAVVDGYAETFPHPLDHDNGLGRNVPLPSSWYLAPSGVRPRRPS